MPNATQKKYQKHEYARNNLYVTQTKNLNKKFYTVHTVREENKL